MTSHCIEVVSEFPWCALCRALLLDVFAFCDPCLPHGVNANIGAWKLLRMVQTLSLGSRNGGMRRLGSSASGPLLSTPHSCSEPSDWPAYFFEPMLRASFLWLHFFADRVLRTSVTTTRKHI